MADYTPCQEKEKREELSPQGLFSFYIFERRIIMPSKFKLKIKLFFKRNSSFLLTCVGVAGMVTTVVLSVKTTPKAMELIKDDSRTNHDGDPYGYTKIEAIRSSWKCYVAPMAIGSASLICILGAGILSKHQQKSLTSAYLLMANTYQEYRKKARELYGEDADRKIRESIAVEKCKDVYIYNQLTGDSLDFGDDKDETVHLFYDVLSNRYFETSLSRVLQAENHLNRNFMIGGYAKLNDFYDFLGLKKTKNGELLGWSNFNYEDIFWLDFDHQKTVMDDGLECYIIEPFYTPTADFLEYI